MDQETITEAPGNDSGADTNAGILSEADLASSFLERVEEQPEEKPSETEATDQTSENDVAEAEEDSEGNVLSQSEQSEETETEEDEEPAEGEQPKAVSKLLKQVGKLTARAKGAEEVANALKAEIQALKTQPQQETQEQRQPALEDIQSFADLEKLRKEALSAKRFALQNVGKDYVELDGVEYDGDQIRNILTEAEDFLTEKIPQRANFLQQRQQWVTDATATFPFLSDTESEEYQLFLQIRGGDQYRGILDQLPNGDFVAATLVKGIKAVKADQANASKVKAKTPKSPPPTDVGDSAGPPPESKDVRQKKKRAAALGKGRISEDQLATFLNT
jgi:hypothetical protein|tara:strand:- start:598 stop:1596 length:999 start_codon:yes stop_codon:yes gene_type:complete